jgi:hypothetical protein
MSDEQQEEVQEEAEAKVAPKKKRAAKKVAESDCMMYKGGVETGVVVRAGEQIPAGYKDAPEKA